MRLVLVVACGLLLSSCATKHKTYRAPDPAKVHAATRQVEDDLVEARKLSREARKFVTDAQKNADVITTRSLDLHQKAVVLMTAVPEPFKAQALEIVKGIAEQQADEAELTRNLSGAQAKNEELEKHQTKTDKDVAALKQEQANYFRNAQKLADDATMEREHRIKAEKQLVKEKWIRILWKIGGGFVVVLIIGGVILYFTGKLGVVLAKVGIKTAL